MRHDGVMPGPLHAPLLLILYPFRFRDTLTGKWVRAKYAAKRHKIVARYADYINRMSRSKAARR